MGAARARALMALARAKTATLPPRGVLVDDTGLLDALSSWLGSPDAIGATELPDGLVSELVDRGVDRRAAVTVGRMVLAEPMTGRSRFGAPQGFAGMPAVRWVAVREPEMRARYIVAASRRLTVALLAGRWDAGLRDERRFLDAHVQMGRRRRFAARRVDELAAQRPVLVWRTAGDNRVESRCRALEGRLFTAEAPPDGVWPGAVHPHCRCYPVGWGGFPGHLPQLLGGG